MCCCHQYDWRRRRNETLKISTKCTKVRPDTRFSLRRHEKRYKNKLKFSVLDRWITGLDLKDLSSSLDPSTNARIFGLVESLLTQQNENHQLKIFDVTWISYLNVEYFRLFFLLFFHVKVRHLPSKYASEYLPFIWLKLKAQETANNESESKWIHDPKLCLRFQNSNSIFSHFVLLFFFRCFTVFKFFCVRFSIFLLCRRYYSRFVCLHSHFAKRKENQRKE